MGMGVFNPMRNHQRGITRLETAIDLIAFVVFSSVFAFAALSTVCSPATRRRKPSRPVWLKPEAAWN